MAGRPAAGTLAARGARNPDALAAFIASRAQAGQTVLSFAGGGSQDDEGSTMTCPRCGYTGRDFGSGGTSTSGEDGTLRTPAPDTGYVRHGAPLTVRSSVRAPGLANPMGEGISLATPRYPVLTANDVLVRSRAGGGAEIRHRRGGTLIGEIRREDDGWKAAYNGRDLRPHSHQRGALSELLSTWNTGTTTMERPAAPLQPAPVQTELMAQYGVPAIRALATPTVGSSDGARTTTSSASDNDADDGKGSGLSPKGQAIKKKLMAKGWPDAKADMFARRAQSFGGSGS